MFLSTIQPIVVWKEIETKGVYRADEAQIEMLPDFKHAYRWLVEQMEIKIGPRPEGVTWPVWAWYMHRNRKGRLDLRREENWCDEPSVCIECEIPDDQVVLSDFIAWHFVLNRSSCLFEQELDEALDLVIERSSDEVAQRLKEATWPNIFDLFERPDNRWMGEVEDIQATFWELRREQVLSVRPCRVYKKPRI